MVVFFLNHIKRHKLANIETEFCSDTLRLEDRRRGMIVVKNKTFGGEKVEITDDEVGEEKSISFRSLPLFLTLQCFQK